MAANFLCDNSAYMLGIDAKGKPERTRECFAACVRKHMEILEYVQHPMAKAILQSKELPWPMEIGSRGLVVLFPQPVNQKVEAVLARNGLSAKDHTTTPLTAEDINDDTLLLVMEDSQREKIREDFPDAPHLQTIAGFLRLAGDIPALYGEPLTEYGKCYEALEFLIEGVLARLKEEEEQ